MMRWLMLLGVVMLLWLQITLWFGEGGVLKLWMLQRAITTQQSENEQLIERNRTLAAEVRDLKEGFTAIEERARSELGMVRQDEQFYQVLE